MTARIPLVLNSGAVQQLQTGDTINANTATALQTARNIDGQAFDGTANITVIAPGTHAATGKTTPVDADEVPIVDSAASNVLKKLTWANLKATLKTYFDTLYAAAGAGGGTTINPIINGGFTVNQRVYVSGATLSSGSYGHDRWKAGSGGGDYSFTQLASNTQITIAASKTLIQVVEDKNVSASSYVLSWAGTALARVGVNSATPSGSYAASPITITGQTPGTTLSVEFGNGASTGTLGTVLLTPGAAAGTFASRLYDDELTLCLRYLPRTQGSLPAFAYGSGGVLTAIATTDFCVPARIAPTGIQLSGAATNWNLFDATAAANALTSLTFNAADVTTGRVTGVIGAAAMVAGNASILYGASGFYILWTGCEL